jgi:hypothetical protein
VPTSLSLDIWLGSRSARLDEIEAAHQSIGGLGPGRRFATQQLNRVYAVLLAAQFQGFCTNLHAECVAAIVGTLPSSISALANVNFRSGLAMRRGNAGPGNIGNDFERLGVSLWPDLYRRDGRNRKRNAKLDVLNTWRNAIAHDDFENTTTFPQKRQTVLRLSTVKAWRSACDQIASDMDEHMRTYLTHLLGTPPW